MLLPGMPKWAQTLYDSVAETIVIIKVNKEEIDRLRDTVEKQGQSMTALEERLASVTRSMESTLNGLDHEVKHVETRVEAAARAAATTAILETYGDTIKTMFEIRDKVRSQAQIEEFDPQSNSKAANQTPGTGTASQ